jgi:5'-3' exonuclease
MVLSGMELLEAMGVPALRAPGEGEAQAAHLCEMGEADHVATEDWDALLHGVPSLLKDFGTSGCEQILLDVLLDEQDWTLEELRWYGALRGTDYNESVSGVGSVYGMEIINEAESFDAVIASAREYDTVNEDRWRRTLELFEDQEVTDFEPVFEPFDIESAHEIACVKYGLADWQVTNRLKNVDNTEIIES